MAYVFDPKELHRIAQLGTGLPPKEMIEVIVSELEKVYPKYINNDGKWFFSLVAGGSGILTLLHGSFSEYLILFGTPAGTEGFSGRYYFDIHDFIITGQAINYGPDDLKGTVYAQKDASLLKKGKARGFSTTPGTWILEYGRGPIVTALPISVGDAIFSAMDFRTVFETFYYYAKEVIGNLFKGKI